VAVPTPSKPDLGMEIALSVMSSKTWNEIREFEATDAVSQVMCKALGLQKLHQSDFVLQPGGVLKE
jgi:hypothetical protein